MVYNTLLRQISTGDLQTSEPWVNETLHLIIVIVMLFDFLLITLPHRIRWRGALVWTIYPKAGATHTKSSPGLSAG